MVKFSERQSLFKGLDKHLGFLPNNKCGVFLGYAYPVLLCLVVGVPFYFFSDLKSWHPKYCLHVATLVSLHFNVLALLTAFVASAGIIFRSGIWEKKRNRISKIVDDLKILESGESIPKECLYFKRSSISANLVFDDADFESFKDLAHEDLDKLGLRFGLLTRLFFYNNLCIAILCVASCLFSYQSVFACNIQAYHISYVLAICAVVNSLAHLAVVGLPKWTFRKIKKILEGSALSDNFQMFLLSERQVVEETDMRVEMILSKITEDSATL